MAREKREPVGAAVPAPVLAGTDDRLAHILRSVQVLVRVRHQLPAGVPVRHENALQAHAAAELLRIVAQRTLEEVARGQGQLPDAVPMVGAVAAVARDRVAGQAERVATDDALLVRVVLALELGAVTVAVRHEIARELRVTASGHATGQVEDARATLGRTIYAGILEAAVPAHLRVQNTEHMGALARAEHRSVRVCVVVHIVTDARLRSPIESYIK